MAKTAKFKNPYFPKHLKTQQWWSLVKHWFWQSEGWAYTTALALMIIVGGYAVIHYKIWWLDTITITGNTYLTVDQLADPTRQVLQQRRWGIVPQRFSLLTNTDTIAAAIRQALSATPALNEVTVAITDRHTITIAVTERVPGLIYINKTSNYYIDRQGNITEINLAEANLNPHFPRVRDKNENRQIEIDRQVLPIVVVNTILALQDSFTADTGLNISEFQVPPVTCREKQFVSDTIFADDIANTEDEVLRQEKIDILQQLENDQITVDQSLALLEELKARQNTTTTPSTGPNQPYIQLEPQYVATDCNFSAVIRDVGIVTQEGPIVYFDSTLDLNQQTSHLVALLRDKIEHVEQLDYIDLRYTDRLFYK